ncbi:hypothetical protein MLD38_003100 [Melastoma candidum]|uniref:Uncharacterized protein n=1 Tax=Melastoma candidum TaxID=119954 RepID=A0ACB9S327_9MYRT|nr:hypothetical protein MLD38_003100 [Melastoma candidum]
MGLVMSSKGEVRGVLRKGSSGCCRSRAAWADLRNANQYHRRHRVCENLAKAQVVLVSGVQQRFCQQCSRFHDVSEFDESKRSCRKRLVGHNERRRKPPAEPTSNNASSSSKRVACGQVNVEENASYNTYFQINKVAPAPSLLS